jgi:hypothetical protein
MRPPFKIELYDANGSAQIINFAWSFEAAERVVREHVGGLGPNEVIRIRDSAGALVQADLGAPLQARPGHGLVRELEFAFDQSGNRAVLMFAYSNRD